MDAELQSLLKAAEFPWDPNEFRDLLARHSQEEINRAELQEDLPAEPSRAVDPPPRELNAEQMRLLSAVELELRVEVSRVSLTVDELLDLVPGKVLERSISLAVPVVLRLGDTVLANARFVKQQGRLALQIISLPGDKNGEQAG